MSYNNSMSYSYCSSELNRSIYLPQSFRLFDDSVTPTYKVEMISHLPTQAPSEDETADCVNLTIHFILLS